MDQHIRPFLFEGEQMVRVADLSGSPWFVVVDVCKAISLANTTRAIAALDEDERSTLTFSKGGPDLLIISESGLYTLILRSHDAIKPGTIAHRFRKWVTAEVLPALRQTGHYEAPRSPAETDEGEPIQAESPDSLKLRMVNTTCRVFGERAAAQMWFKQSMPIVPAMKPMLDQFDLLEIETTTVTRTINGGHH